MAKKRLKTFYVQEIHEYEVKAESVEDAWRLYSEQQASVVDKTIFDHNHEFIE